MPTSMTTAPGLTMSAVSTLRLPDGGDDDVGLQRDAPSGPAVALCADGDGGVLGCSSIRAIGLPTMLLRPMTTACLPRRSCHADGFQHLHAAIGRAGPEAGRDPPSAHRRWRRGSRPHPWPAKWLRSPCVRRCGLGKRQLHQDAVDGWVVVQGIDAGQQLGLGHGGVVSFKHRMQAGVGGRP